MALALSFAALVWTAAAAATAPIAVSVPARRDPVSYALEVAAVLDASCLGCHNGARAENRLNLEDVAGMLKGGKRGPAIRPGRADESLLFQMAAHRVEPPMPPPTRAGGRPLTPAELGLLKLWIDGGARDDSDLLPEPPRTIELGPLPSGFQPIVAVDMSADGRQVAAGRANVVQVYDADSGLEIISLGGHKDIVQSLRYSPDGSRLAAGGYQVVTLWDVPRGGVDRTFAGHRDAVEALAVADEGRTIYSGGLDRSIRVWNVAEDREVRRIDHPAAAVLALAVAAEGRSLVTGGSDHVVRILSVADGKETAALKGHVGPILDLACSPTNGRVASVSADGTGRIWTIPETAGAPIAPPILLNGHTGPVRAVAWTADGSSVVTGGDDASIRVWDAGSGKLARTILGHKGPVRTLAIAPGTRVWTGSADRTVRLFDLAGGPPLLTLSGHRGPVQSVALSRDGRRLVTAGAEGGVKVWETATGQGVIAFGHVAPNRGAIRAVNKVAFTSGNSFVSASADSTLKSWSFTGTWAARPPLGPHVFRVLALDFSPDGTLLATGGGEPSRSGEVKLWDVGSGRLVRTFDALHSDTVFGLRFSPDGLKLASASADKFLKVRRVADGLELKSFEGHTQHVLAVDWRSDGKQLVTAGGDSVLKVWDFDTGEQVRTLQPAGKQVTAVRWVPGKPLVAGSSGDKLVRYWNADSGSIDRVFQGPSDFVFGVATSRDGTRVAAGGADSVLFIWDGDRVEVLQKIEPPAASP